MATFSVGDPVEVTGIGPGIIDEVRGGSVDRLYHVVLFGLAVDTGLPTSRVVRDVDMTPGDPLPALQIGDPVRYIGRVGSVVALTERHGIPCATFVLPADPVEGMGEVSEPRRFDMPVWQIVLHQQTL